MKNFFWISRLYFKRQFFDLANYLMVGLPIIFLTVFYLTDRFLQTLQTSYELANNPLANVLTLITIPMILCFQFFGTDAVASALHEDLKGPTGARLKVSGNDERVFYLAVVAAAWLFYLLTGAVVIAVAHFIFSIYFASVPLTFLALALLALMAQIIGVMMFYFTKDSKTSGRFAYLFGEVMIGIALFPFVFVNMPEVIKNILNWFPVGIGLRLIETTNFAEAMLLVGVLLGMSVALSVAVFVIGRRKGYDRL